MYACSHAVIVKPVVLVLKAVLLESFGRDSVHNAEAGWNIVGTYCTNAALSHRRGWFPSSYCRPYTELASTNRWDESFHTEQSICLSIWMPVDQYISCVSSSRAGTPLSSMSHASLPEQEEEEPVLLPPPDYSDDSPSRPTVGSAPSPRSSAVSTSSCWLF